MSWDWLLGEGSWWQIVFPVLIFLARVCDVTLGTLRMVAVSREQKAVAAVLGFFEVLIWLTAVSYILQHLTTVINYFAYAGGFATGNYLGLKIEEKLALGVLQVTIITNRDARPLIEELRREDFGLTSVSAMGATGRVRMVITVVRRRDLERLRQLVQRSHPNAFMTVQSIREASKPIQSNRESVRRPWLFLRKAK
ncbi:MAG: DUF2179 domain-containing protein [Acidobacteriota bacterium]